MDTSILDIYNYQQNNDSIKLPEPSGITEMFRRTLGYVYNFIKQNRKICVFHSGTNNWLPGLSKSNSPCQNPPMGHLLTSYSTILTSYIKFLKFRNRKSLPKYREDTKPQGFSQLLNTI